MSESGSVCRFVARLWPAVHAARIGVKRHQSTRASPLHNRVMCKRRAKLQSFATHKRSIAGQTAPHVRASGPREGKQHVQPTADPLFRHPLPPGALMSKALALILLLAMGIQLLKPLGLPGLRRRRDFWKIAVAAIAVMMLTVLIRP